MGPRAGRSLTFVVLAVMAVAGCGGGAAPTGPGTTDTSSPSAPALDEDELAVCDGTVRMSDGVTRLEGIRLRRGASNTLGSAVDLVLEGQQLVLDYAPGRMRPQVRTLGFAVTNLTIAVEGLRTAERVEAAASNIRRRITSLRKAVDHFRSWVGCPGATANPEASTRPPADPGG